MADRSRCPNCGERVSPYAAGCAICGADLDPSRWDRGSAPGQRVGSWVSAFTFAGIGGKWLLLVVLLALFGAPLLAALNVY